MIIQVHKVQSGLVVRNAHMGKLDLTLVGLWGRCQSRNVVAGTTLPEGRLYVGQEFRCAFALEYGG